MKKKTSEMTIAELRARAAEIRTEVNAEGADLDALEAEADEISQRIAQYETEQRRLGIAAKVADGAGAPQDNPTAHTDAQTRAQQFKETRQGRISVAETRSVLISGGKLATPTEVSGINDVVGPHVSSIVDLVKVVNCDGMGSNKVAYIKTDVDAAAEQTEGAAATVKEPTFGTVTISPSSVAVLAYISRQVQKQSPLLYEAKVREQALLALRKKASALIVGKLKESTLVVTKDATVDSGKKGVINDKTLRNLVLAFGGDEGVEGGAVLFLNKADLVAFGDVRGTNEKKAVYEIEPDTDNPNTGIIKDGPTHERCAVMHRRSALRPPAAFLLGATMYWTEEITLMQDEPEKKQGVLVHSYTPVRKVYGERKSVGWREFFAAEAAGTTLSAVFVLHADEYNGERVLLWKGSLYSVQRAYETGSTVELTVSDLPQTKGGPP